MGVDGSEDDRQAAKTYSIRTRQTHRAMGREETRDRRGRPGDGDGIDFAIRESHGGGDGSLAWEDPSSLQATAAQPQTASMAAGTTRCIMTCRCCGVLRRHRSGCWPGVGPDRASEMRS